MEPILLDLPQEILTPRLLLRPPLPGDGVELNAAILETLAELQQWMPWAHPPPNPDDSEANVRRAYAQWILRENLRISLFDRESGKFVGGSGLHRIDWDLPAFEIGYWVRKSFAGQGYIKESTNALTRFAFGYLQAKRVAIHCDAKNLASIGVIRALGFTQEAHLRCDELNPQGSPRDTLIFSRLNIDGLPPLQVDW